MQEIKDIALKAIDQSNEDKIIDGAKVIGSQYTMYIYYIYKIYNIYIFISYILYLK